MFEKWCNETSKYMKTGADNGAEIHKQKINPTNNAKVGCPPSDLPVSRGPGRPKTTYKSKRYPKKVCL